MHGVETEFPLPGTLVPNERDLSMKIIWLAVQCSVADFGDERLYRGVIYLLGFKAFTTRITSETRQADVCPFAFELGKQLCPSRTQGDPDERANWFQSARPYGGQEVGSDIAERFCAQAKSGWSDGRELGADPRERERDIRRIVAQ
jgi:hypothetical protein